MINGASYKLECEQAGSIGNEYYGNLTAISYIHNLTKAVLEDIIIPGKDEEDDDELRKRYISYVTQPAFGGNISDYKIKTKEINGVGGVKVFPVWNGGGTVKLAITDSTNGVPSTDLVSNVQEAIDPEPHQKGLGFAPIGHNVKVVGATALTVNVETKVVLTSGTNLSEVNNKIKEVVNSYFYFLRTKWEKENQTIIRIAQIETRILGIEGVEDVSETKLQGKTTNLTLQEEQVPIVGEVTVK